MKKTTPNEPEVTPAAAERARRLFKGVLCGFVPALFILYFLTKVEGDPSGTEVALALAQRVLMVSLGAAVVGVAGLFGMRLLRLAGCMPENLFGRFILGAGLGLGTLSLATLAFGAAGLVGTAASAGTLGAMLLVGIPELRAVGDLLRAKRARRLPRLSWTELVLVFLFLFVVVFQLILAFGLPTDYDACEYHLAAPARWFQIGRIDYITGNVYSNFPMNCEMLYLFCMGLCGEVMLGVHLSVVMNALVSLLAAGAVYAFARRFFTRRAALAGMTLFLATPWVLVTSTLNVYNEMLLALYATLAIQGVLEFAERRQRRWAIVSAVFAGLAAGVKYTALAFFPPVLALAVMLFAGKVGPLRRLREGVLYAAVALAFVSPWLVKNIVHTGNPTYPFFYRTFGGRDWSAELDAKWIAGQLQAAKTYESGNLFAAVWRRVIGHQFASLALAAFLLLALAAVPERPVRRTFILLALWTLFWYFLTHRVERFWLPMAAPAAALAGRGAHYFRRKWPALVSWAVLVGALAWYVFFDSLLFATYATGTYNLKTANNEVLAKRAAYDLYPLVVFAGTLKAQGHLMLVGEARTLYLPPNVSYSTVFNREVFTSTVGDVGDPAAVGEGLRRAGVTHLFVNWFEIARLRWSYALASPDGEMVPGFPPLSPSDFDRLVEAGVLEELLPWRFGKAPPNLRGLSAEDLAALPGGKLCTVYAVRPEGDASDR